MSRRTKILVIRVGRSGDVVMITPALKFLIEKMPEAEIHVLTSSDGKRLLRGFDEHLTEVIVHKRKSLFEYFHAKKINKQIIQQSYDHIFCFELKPSYKKFFSGSNANSGLGMRSSIKKLYRGL